MANPILIGQAEEIDLVAAEIRSMLAVPGIYLASDSARPRYTVPLYVNDGKVCSMVVDTELAPTRFHPTVQIAGPFYSPEALTFPLTMPPCPFCGGPPCPIVTKADWPYGAAPFEDDYGDEGLAVEAYVFCHECGAQGPKTDWTTIDTKEDYLAVEREGVLNWCRRNSRHLGLYECGLPEGLNVHPRPEKAPATEGAAG